MVICTHCHFDHIGGLETFASLGAIIVASGHDRTFVDKKNRDANSLCSAFGMATPAYDITHFAENGERLQYAGIDLGLRVLLTPGHTPDSLAVYDEKRRWLFTGDTCYKRCAVMPWGEQQDVPIVFPLQGNWKDWTETMDKLIAFVETEDSVQVDRPINIGCGHTTSGVGAIELLRAAQNFGHDVAKGNVRSIAGLEGDAVAPGGSLGDETFMIWHDEGDPEFSMCAPESFERHFEDARINPDQ